MNGSHVTEYDKYDELVHIVCESPLVTGTERSAVTALFPRFDEDNTYYDEVVTAMFLEQYGYYRGIGMSREDAANKCGYSGILMNKLLSGEGLSLDTFIALVKVELFAVAEFKEKHLKNIDAQTIAGKWKASVAILEKLLPHQFGPNAGSDDDYAPPLNIVAYEDPDYEDVKLPPYVAQ